VTAAADITRPIEGQTVGGAFELVVQAPPGSRARRFSLEVAFWDPSRNAWFHAGLFGPDFEGPGTATRRVTPDELARFSRGATQWRMRARVVEPPGPWGAWRTFQLGAAPASDAGKATAARRSPSVEQYGAPAAPTVRLKLWNGLQSLDDNRAYVAGPVHVDWERKDLRWWFQFQSRNEPTTRASAPQRFRWELSRAPFPAWGDWKPAMGFGLAGPVTVAQAPKQFSVDLAPLAPRPKGWGSSGPVVAKPAGAQKPPPAGSPKVPGSPAAQSSSPAVVTNVGSSPGLVGTPAAGPVLLSLYLRVVPVDAAGAASGAPSEAVELIFGPAEKPAPFKFEVAWPQVGFASYRAVRPYDFDWRCWVVATQDIKVVSTVISKGQAADICASDNKDVFEQVADAFSSFVELVKSFANWVSSTYASLKSKLIASVASAIPGCGAQCRGALEMGLDAGLAAVGMPPSLPDFDQLQTMGEGYLVEMVAEQAAQSGVPFAKDAASKALEEMIAQGKAAASSGGGGSGFWIPDASRRYKPLLLVVQVSNPLAKPTNAIHLEVTEIGGDRYLPRKTYVPALASKQSYKVAVALEPRSDPGDWMNLLPTQDDLGKGLMMDAKAVLHKREQAKAAHAAWSAKYQGGQVQLQVSMRPAFGESTGHQIAFKKTCDAKASMCVVQ
jgi:hypothetical protein